MRTKDPGAQDSGSGTQNPVPGTQDSGPMTRDLVT